MLIDLQLHSTYSDGYLTPSEVAGFIAGQKIKVAALTDHNTVGGVDEFKNACKKLKIKAIPGMELYVKLRHKRFNLLWFNFNHKDPELHKLLRESQSRRRARVRKILKKLKAKNYKVDINKILDSFNHYIPINHLVDELWLNNRTRIKKELHNNFPREDEMIREYFYNKKIGMLHESYINIERIIKLRKKIGGQLILNHPGKHNQLQKEFLEKLKKMGIDGLELLSPHHSYGAVMYAQFIADKLKFITTGGSDFHRFEGNGYLLQKAHDYFKIDSKFLKSEEIIN